MKQFTADYRPKGRTGHGVCTADSIQELIAILRRRGYEFGPGEVERVERWADHPQKRYLGARLTITHGAGEMTEYTSL